MIFELGRELKMIECWRKTIVQCIGCRWYDVCLVQEIQPYQVIVTLILSEWGRRDEGGQVRAENVQLREYIYN